ncbi:S8 family serine peptidase [Halomarina pelagica]|uniref:S8 family serine peptidase n=1 Tax=Halomarina pelagica TaxID=2961599 RepID=UPI0020C29237|nr:S8 family serine peptidase [Halomarina sp. BND7]
MEPRDLLAVMVACSLLAVPLAPVPGADAGGETTNDAVLVDRLKTHLYGPDDPESPTVDEEVRVVVRLKQRARLPTADGFQINRVYTSEGTRHVEGSVPLAAVRALAAQPGVQSIRVSSSAFAPDDLVAPGVSAIGADDLHEAGVTGENVTVGVIDSDFRVSHPAIASNVGAYRTFGSGGDWRHGTAVASVVADTAPGATLYLAAIGRSTTAEEYRDAVEWLEASGVDVIVDSGSYYTQPGDGSGSVSRIAAEAAEDTVFVTSVGNHARRYWTGTHGPGDPTWVQFAPNTGGNYLDGGDVVSGRVTLTLRWDGWPKTATDYDLYLVRERPSRDVAVAKATGHDGRPYEHLSVVVPEGRYYVAVKGDRVEGATTLELFANRKLHHRSAGGASAPVMAPGVLAVGASEGGNVRPYSARVGVDLVAPDTIAARGIAVDGGTSFAAPYVAGVAALVVGEHPDLAAEEVRTVLAGSATDVGPAGADDASGAGRVNATAALAAADG